MNTLIGFSGPKSNKPPHRHQVPQTSNIMEPTTLTNNTIALVAYATARGEWPTKAHADAALPSASKVQRIEALLTAHASLLGDRTDDACTYLHCDLYIGSLQQKEIRRLSNVEVFAYAEQLRLDTSTWPSNLDFYRIRPAEGSQCFIACTETQIALADVSMPDTLKAFSAWLQSSNAKRLMVA